MRKTIATIFLIFVAFISVFSVIADQINITNGRYTIDSYMTFSRDGVEKIDINGYREVTNIENSPLRVSAYTGFASARNGNYVDVNANYYWNMEVGVLNFQDNINEFGIVNLDSYSIRHPSKGYSWEFYLSPYEEYSVTYDGVTYYLLTPYMHAPELWTPDSYLFYDDISYTYGGLVNPNKLSFDLVTNNINDYYWLWGFFVPENMLTGVHDFSSLNGVKLAVLFSFTPADDYMLYVYDDIKDTLDVDLSFESVLSANFMDYYNLLLYDGELVYKAQYTRASDLMADLSNTGRIGRELGNITSNYYIEWIADTDNNMPVAPDINSWTDIIDGIVYIGELLWWGVSVIGYGIVGSLDITASIIRIIGYFLGII